MARFAAVLAATALLAGCATTGGTASSSSDSAGSVASDSSAGEVKPNPLPTEKSLSETHDAASKGRPKEAEGLSVVAKRQLFARYVMTSCVKKAPDLLAGLRASALQPSGRLKNGAQSFADRSFKVAASSNGRFCDVRALGGGLDKFADSMRLAVEKGGAQVLSWERAGDGWRGVVMIKGKRYVLSAKSQSLNAGAVHIALLRRG